jgi:hypothetical protein
MRKADIDERKPLESFNTDEQAELRPRVASPVKDTEMETEMEILKRFGPFRQGECPSRITNGLVRELSPDGELLRHDVFDGRWDLSVRRVEGWGDGPQ